MKLGNLITTSILIVVVTIILIITGLEYSQYSGSIFLVGSLLIVILISSLFCELDQNTELFLPSNKRKRVIHSSAGRHCLTRYKKD